jgi:SAM-dependent methyltransferase
VRLSTSLEALAALAAHIRLESEGLESDPRVRDLLAKVAGEVLGEGASVSGSAGAPVVGMTLALLRQAAELVENPGRSGSWEQVDEGLLQGYGRLSAAIVDAVQAAEGQLDGLRERLHASGSAFLDVGTGTAWLAIAMARRYPALDVVGMDIFGPALDLARRNLTAEGMEDRVTLQLQDVTTMAVDEAFDAIWLPLPFLPADVVPPALDACTRALRPGGWVLPGTFAGPPDRLSQLLLDVRTVRAGGHPWREDELLAVVAGAGFTDVCEVPRTWAAPVRLYAGRRP